MTRPPVSLPLSLRPPTRYGAAVPYPYALAEIDGTHIQRGDMRVLLSTIGSVMPKPGDTLTIGSTVYRVVSATSIAPASVDIVYEAQVRAP